MVDISLKLVKFFLLMPILLVKAKLSDVPKTKKVHTFFASEKEIIRILTNSCKDKVFNYGLHKCS